jgi:protein TonB
MILVIAALLVAGIGAAYFEHGIPWPSQAKPAGRMVVTTPAKSPPAVLAAAVSASATGAAPPVSVASTVKPDSAAGQNQTMQSALSPVARPVSPSSADTQHSTSANGVVVKEADKSSSAAPGISEKPARVNPVSKRAILRAAVESSNVPPAETSISPGYIAPKLVKAARPNSPAEALQGFISGNVVLDALVDPAGHVKSTKVVSGPEKLRKAALDAVREYIYEPAMQNGKPVSAHVNVAVQFWYEP